MVTPLTTVPPSKEDVELARASGQRLAPLARRGRPLTLRVRDAGKEQTIELPAGAVKLLQAILEDMASGRAVTIVPQNAELTCCGSGGPELALSATRDMLTGRSPPPFAGAISMLAQFGMFFGSFGNGDNTITGLATSARCSCLSSRHFPRDRADGDQPHPPICRRQSRRLHQGPRLSADLRLIQKAAPCLS